MNVKEFINFIPMTSISSATFTGAYQLLSASGGVSEPCTAFKIVNNSNVDVTVSLNGTVDHDFIPTMSFVLYDAQANAQPNNDKSVVAKGQKFYVKGSAGTGSVYLVGLMNPISNFRGL